MSQAPPLPTGVSGSGSSGGGGPAPVAGTDSSSASNLAIDTKNSLGLAIVGNCNFSALIDKNGTVVWACLPRFDADPVFCGLLRRTKDIGFFDIALAGFERSEQSYIKNTPIVRTRLFAKDNSGAVEIIDFAPRFRNHGRMYHPTMLIRIITPIMERPRGRIRLRPTFGYGWGTPEKTRGSNHIRFMLPTYSVRLTSNAPIAYIADEVLFDFDEPIYLVIMPDESLQEPLSQMCLANLDKTKDFWQEWVKGLAIPFEYQSEVIRASISLSLNSYEETGAIIAASTTSVPAAPDATKFDGRYFWLRDSYYIVNTMTSLGATSQLEPFLRFISNILSMNDSQGNESSGSALQPVYGISLETRLHQRDMHRLAGYRSLGPVVVGSSDYDKKSNDTYGSLICALTQTFFDNRLQFPGDELLFKRLEKLGDLAVQSFGTPDCGPVGLQDQSLYKNHTFSMAMAWAAADRLGKIAEKLKVKGSRDWKGTAAQLHSQILTKAYNAELKSFVSYEGATVPDAYLLLLPDLQFIKSSDEKFQGTLALIEKELLVGKHYIKRVKGESYGYIPATFWYVTALVNSNRRDDARSVFEYLLKHANHCGLFSESINPENNELWGNFPYTTSMVSLTGAAVALSKSWKEAI